MKSEVYSWRVSADLKTGLEREAHRRKLSLSAVLDLAARDWLKRSGAETDDDAQQLRLKRAASKCIGVLASNAHGAENARNDLRQLLRRRYGR